MPQLVKLQEEYKDQGFVVIGTHVQNVGKEQVVQYLRSEKVNFTVTSFGSIDVPDKLSGIPAAYLFNSKGELVLSGRPQTMKNDIVALIESEPHFLAAGRDYTNSSVAKLAAALKKARSFSPIIKRLGREVDRDESGDAKYLLDRLLDHGKAKLARAKELESEDALAAMESYSHVASNFKGDDVGDQAAARIKELKKDKEFETELKAATIAEKILVACDDLKATGGSINLDYAPNKKIAAKVHAGMRLLLKDYSDARATERLKADLKSYGFTFE